MKQYLLYQYSADSFNYIKEHYDLHNRLKVQKENIIPISHQKALVYTKKDKKELRKLIDKFNDKYNQRIRLS